MTERMRHRLAILLIVGASLALLASEAFVWADDAVFDSAGFASRAEAALADEDVRAFITTKVVDLAIEQGSPDLVTARPLIEAAVEAALESRAFRNIYVAAIRGAHATLLTDQPIVLELFDAMIFVQNALAGLDPDLAERLPDIDSAVIEISEQRELDAIRRVADRAEVNAAVFPALTALLVIAAIAVAPDRRRAVVAAGVAAAVSAAIAIVALDIAGAALEAAAPTELSGAAIDGAWQAFLGDLRRWNFLLGGLAIAIVAAATSTMPRFDPRADLARAERIVRIEAGWARWLRATLAVVLGVAALTRPELLARTAIVGVGIYLLYAGLAELFRLLGLQAPARAATDEPDSARLSAPLRVAAFAALFVAGASLAASVVVGLGPFDRDAESPFDAPGDELACNGHVVLCDRPLDQVTLPATHNSMSAVDAGWLLASHGEGIADQLNAGIRGLLIDVWHGFPTDNGVRTELLAGDRDRLVSQYGLELVEARDRIAATLGAGGERELFLCHGFCELGATRFSDTLSEIRRFLAGHPRDVLVIVIQDEAPTDAIADAFVDAGLDQLAYAHPAADAPWPTLRELVDASQPLIVMTERGGASEPWFHDAFALAQETPFAFSAPEEFSCAPNRGNPNAQLFLVNHWIEDLTPSPRDADTVNASSVLLPRLQNCQRERGLAVNLVAVNFFRRGDLFEVVDQLNGVGGSE